MNLGRDIVKDARGGALLEFALVAPVFFLLFIGTIEFGIIKFGNEVIDNVVSKAARESLVGCKKGEYDENDQCMNGIDMNEIRSTISRRSAGFVKVDDGSRFQLAVRSAGSGNCRSGVDLGGPLDIRVFHACYSWGVMTPFIRNLFPNNTLNFETVTIVRNEAFRNRGE